MEIDYELVDKIGATHYSECGEYYRLDNKKIMHLAGGQEAETSNNAWWCVKNLKPITPKPPVRVEYEKVTESIFDLKDEFERENLYMLNSYDNYLVIDCIKTMAEAALDDNLYRRIEKPVYEKEEFIKHCMEVATEDDTENDRIWMSKLYDSGVRLVTK